MPDPEIQTIATTIHGRFLIDRVGTVPDAPIFVGFHGYGQSAAAMLGPLRRIAPEGSVLVAVQGLHRFYTRGTGEIVAHWMTSEDRELMIADNAEYAGRVVAQVKHRIGGEAGPLFYVGFSQGVPMAYRSALFSGHETAAVIALGGDLPPDLEEAALRRLPRILIGRGSGEEWYTEEKLAADVGRLGRAGVRFESKPYQGGHEWTEEFIGTCAVFVESVLSQRRLDGATGPRTGAGG